MIKVIESQVSDIKQAILNNETCIDMMKRINKLEEIIQETKEIKQRIESELKKL